MRKKLVIIAFCLIGATGIALLGWRMEWFIQSPASVFKNSLTQANAGNYDEANRNLPDGRRKQLQDDPELTKRVWDKITKNGTLRAIDITRENRGPLGTMGELSFTLTYKDGSTIVGKEVIGKIDGRWTHEIGDLYQMILKAELPPAKLAHAYSQVEGAGVSLRIPEGCVYDRFKRDFDHPQLKIQIGVDHEPGRTLSRVLAFAEKTWKDPKNRLTQKKDILGDSRWKRVLFEGTSLSTNDMAWTLFILVVGDEQQAVLISGLAPPGESYRKVVEESLLTVKWNPETPQKLLDKLDFAVVPSEPFFLDSVRSEIQGILFAVKNQDPASPESARFVAIKTPALFPGEQASTGFDRLVKNLQPPFTKPTTLTIQPLKVGTLEGFEAVGTVFQTESKVTVFRYTAVLIAGNGMYWFEGTAPLGQIAEYDGPFREMTKSFKVKSPP